MVWLINNMEDRNEIMEDIIKNFGEDNPPEFYMKVMWKRIHEEVL